MNTQNNKLDRGRAHEVDWDVLINEIGCSVDLPVWLPAEYDYSFKLGDVSVDIYDLDLCEFCGHQFLSGYFVIDGPDLEMFHLVGDNGAALESWIRTEEEWGADRLNEFSDLIDKIFMKLRNIDFRGPECTLNDSQDAE